MNFLIFNGKILKFDDVTFCEFYLENSLQLTQKIWFGFGGIPLFFQNIELLINQAEILHIPLPSQVKKTDEMFRLSKRMLNKNKYYRSGFIIFKIISDGTSSHIIATSEPAAGQGLPFTDQGLLVSVSDYKKFADNNLNRYLFLIRHYGIHYYYRSEGPSSVMLLSSTIRTRCVNVLMEIFTW